MAMKLRGANGQKTNPEGNRCAHRTRISPEICVVLCAVMLTGFQKASRRIKPKRNRSRLRMIAHGTAGKREKRNGIIKLCVRFATEMLYCLKLLRIRNHCVSLILVPFDNF